MNSKLKRSAAYARFSSDNQREESIDAQLRAIHEYAQRNGLVVVKEYIDRAKSATTDNRPEFLQMIEDVTDGSFDCVIVHKLDRFSRNRYDSAFYKRQLKRAGIQLFSVVEHLDDSPESVIMESVLEGMSEYYSKNLAREVRKGLHENALKGVHTGGIPPLGYDLDPQTKTLIVNEGEAEIVRLIFNRTLEGYGYGEIMDELNRLECRTKRGHAFSKNSLYSILKNEKYIGTYIYNRSASKDVDGKRNGHRQKPREEWIVIEDAIPAIIDKEDFELVKRKMATRMQTRSHSHAKERYFLTSKMECGICGGSYVGTRRRRGNDGTLWTAYGCNRRQRTKSADCRNKEVSKEAVERFVLERLAEYVFDDRYIPKITREYNRHLKAQVGASDGRQRTLQSRLVKMEKEIDRLVDLLMKSSSNALLDRLNALEEDKVVLQSELDTVQRQAQERTVTEAEVRDAFAQIRRLLSAGELGDVKRVIDTYIQKIVVWPEKVVVYFNFFPRLTLDFDGGKTTEEGIKKEDRADTRSSDFAQPIKVCTQKLADDLGGEGGTRTLAPVARPTPLAGAPRHQLEYFSVW